MYYILDRQIGLRSWWLVPYAYYVRHDRTAKGLKKEEYDFLALCDGLHDLPENKLAKDLCEKGLCQMVEKGAALLSDWQKPMVCNNRYMPSMNWMITGKCNYNCIHCFNAADNSPIQSEFSFEEAEKLMDEAQNCGINGFTITGGEPMAHKRFIDIVRGIYARGMYIFELNTNGFYLTQEILDEMKCMDCHPLMKISFDGMGFHDFMRGHKGAEKDAIRAIKLCIENGFMVKVQMQINHINKDCISESLELMDRLGVWETRVIRTSESPRWEINHAGKSLSITEYYEECLKIAKKYISQKHRMYVDFWHFLTLNPQTKEYIGLRGHKMNENFRETFPLCRSNRGMIAVRSDGQVYPCLQMSGLLLEHGKSFSNVKTEGLQRILQNSDYMTEVCATLHDLTSVNEECRNCPHLQDCCGGCRALAIVTDGGLRGTDRASCLFYKNHYPEKIAQTLLGYQESDNCE